jgi:hypothetical protein
MVEVYWIVIDFFSTFPVFRNIIIELWELGNKSIPNVKSIIVVSDKTAEKAEDAIRELYSRACFGIDGPNCERPTYIKYHNLIENAVMTFTENGDIEEMLEEMRENGTAVFNVSTDISERFFYENVMKIIEMQKGHISKTTVFIVS